MRDIARRIHARVSTVGGHVLAGVGLTAVAVTTMVGLQAAPTAAAAAAPPKIASAFTPNLIGVGDTDATALSVTITNPNASGTLTSVAFTDTLPAGLTVDDPNGENGTCGSSGVITAAPGSQTISLTGGSVKAAASCTISVSVVSSQPGVVQNSTSPVSSSAGASATGDTETLTVLPPPTVTVTHVRNNARYDYGEVVRPIYSCAQPGDAPALADCSAQDDLGNDVGSGQALKTKLPGLHSLTVSATSVDGLVTSDTIDYTVLPNNRFTISRVRPRAGGALTFQLALPGAGTVKVVESAGRSTLGTYTGRVGGARKLQVTVKPSASAAALLSGGSGTRVSLGVTFTPKGGVKRTVIKRGVILT